jgi:hypothetical protein
MSSRSEVIIAIRKGIDIPDNVRDAMSDADRTHETDKAKYWYWKSIKWHQGTEQIDAIEDFFRTELEEDDFAFLEFAEYNEVVQDGNLEEYEITFERVMINPITVADQESEQKGSAFERDINLD